MYKHPLFSDVLFGSKLFVNISKNIILKFFQMLNQRPINFMCAYKFDMSISSYINLEHAVWRENNLNM